MRRVGAGPRSPGLRRRGLSQEGAGARGRWPGGGPLGAGRGGGGRGVRPPLSQALHPGRGRHSVPWGAGGGHQPRPCSDTLGGTGGSCPAQGRARRRAGVAHRGLRGRHMVGGEGVLQGERAGPRKAGPLFQGHPRGHAGSQMDPTPQEPGARWWGPQGRAWAAISLEPSSHPWKWEAVGCPGPRPQGFPPPSPRTGPLRTCGVGHAPWGGEGERAPEEPLSVLGPLAVGGLRAEGPVQGPLETCEEG